MGGFVGDDDGGGVAVVVVVVGARSMSGTGSGVGE